MDRIVGSIVWLNNYVSWTYRVAPNVDLSLAFRLITTATPHEGIVTLRQAELSRLAPAFIVSRLSAAPFSSPFNGYHVVYNDASHGIAVFIDETSLLSVPEAA